MYSEMSICMYYHFILYIHYYLNIYKYCPLMSMRAYWVCYMHHHYWEMRNEYIYIHYHISNKNEFIHSVYLCQHQRIMIIYTEIIKSLTLQCLHPNMFERPNACQWIIHLTKKNTTGDVVRISGRVPPKLFFGDDKFSYLDVTVSSYSTSQVCVIMCACV